MTESESEGDLVSLTERQVLKGCQLVAAALKDGVVQCSYNTTRVTCVGASMYLRFSTSKFCAVASTDTSLSPHPQQFRFRIEIMSGARDRLRASSRLRTLMVDSHSSPTS